jgi:hypothetical protein
VDPILAAVILRSACNLGTIAFQSDIPMLGTVIADANYDAVPVPVRLSSEHTHPVKNCS